MLFDTVNYLLYNKNKKDLDSELLEYFDPFITMKMASFYNEASAIWTNDHLNIYGHIFKNKEDTFMFYQNILPNFKWKRIDYLKKVKKEPDKSKQPETIPEFYSKREMRDMGFHV